MIARLLTLTWADLRTQLRSPMVLLFAIVVPAALIVVLHLVFSSAVDGSSDEVVVAVTGLTENADEEPSPADPTAAAVAGALRGLDSVQVTDSGDARAAVAGGDADLGVLIRGPRIELVRGDVSDIDASVVSSVVTGVAAGLRAVDVAVAAATELGVDPSGSGEVAGATLTTRPGQVADEQLDVGGALVAGQAGLFLLFTVGFAVLTLNTEREQGTLQRLYAAPMPRWLVIAAKALTAAILGCVATGILLVTGSVLFDIDFGAVPVVAGLVVAVVLAATSVAFIVARIARTAEQATMAQTVVALVLGIAGGAFSPLAATGIAARILDANPISAFSRGLGISSAGGGWAEVSGELLTMAAFTFGCLVVARLVPDRGQAR
ncbi:ABC transporter permease [Pseudactinotalea sp. HY158]|uniref:ABC transporter permease n=1 Tax=Pseudactinotalea sp. HY158 TaxID=2654547 RepID=UPI00129CA145|nr:ABC transporter permease [Pseudactinotalea sp. HY158]QGH70247.1 ABC transporter permease subunit [Pseudactinotalea sp. HY158]